MSIIKAVVIILFFFMRAFAETADDDISIMKSVLKGQVELSLIQSERASEIGTVLCDEREWFGLKAIDIQSHSMWASYDIRNGCPILYQDKERFDLVSGLAGGGGESPPVDLRVARAEFIRYFHENPPVIKAMCLSSVDFDWDASEISLSSGHFRIEAKRQHQGVPFSDEGAVFLFFKQKNNATPIITYFIGTLSRDPVAQELDVDGSFVAGAANESDGNEMMAGGAETSLREMIRRSGQVVESGDLIYWNNLGSANGVRYMHDPVENGRVLTVPRLTNPIIKARRKIVFLNNNKGVRKNVIGMAIVSLDNPLRIFGYLPID